jgi:hypothetical protein
MQVVATVAVVDASVLRDVAEVTVHAAVGHGPAQALASWQAQESPTKLGEQ